MEGETVDIPINQPGKAKRAQSAMEYLMTYGWAILIIAVVLAALFQLGVFSGIGAPTFCIAQAGFSCQSLTFNANINNAYTEPSFTINFSTSSYGWTQVYLAVVPIGQPLTNTNTMIADYIVDKNDFYHWGLTCGFYYGPIASLSQYHPVSAIIYGTPSVCPAGSGKIGTHVTGAIWAIYTPNNGGSTATNVLIEVATFGATATQS
jgi:hypothetical protein